MIGKWSIYKKITLSICLISAIIVFVVYINSEKIADYFYHTNKPNIATVFYRINYYKNNNIKALVILDKSLWYEKKYSECITISKNILDNENQLDKITYDNILRMYLMSMYIENKNVFYKDYPQFEKKFKDELFSRLAIVNFIFDESMNSNKKDYEFAINECNKILLNNESYTRKDFPLKGVYDVLRYLYKNVGNNEKYNEYLLKSDNLLK